LTGQARMQGRMVSEMALYGQAAAQRPHSLHLAGSIYAPLPVMEIAPNGQAAWHFFAKHF